MSTSLASKFAIQLLFTQKQLDELNLIKDPNLIEKVKKNHYDEKIKFDEYLENYRTTIENETIKNKINHNYSRWDLDLTK